MRPLRAFSELSANLAGAHRGPEQPRLTPQSCPQRAPAPSADWTAPPRIGYAVHRARDARYRGPGIEASCRGIVSGHPGWWGTPGVGGYPGVEYTLLCP